MFSFEYASKFFRNQYALSSATQKFLFSVHFINCFVWFSCCTDDRKRIFYGKIVQPPDKHSVFHSRLECGHPLEISVRFSWSYCKESQPYSECSRLLNCLLPQATQILNNPAASSASRFQRRDDTNTTEGLLKCITSLLQITVGLMKAFTQMELANLTEQRESTCSLHNWSGERLASNNNTPL